MKRILRSVHREAEDQAENKQDLEFNPGHPIIVRLDKIRQTDEPLAVKVAEQVHDNARVAAGLLDDPRTMLKRLNELLEQVLSAKS
jgi:TNF receptor-associated protein 1